MKILIDQTKREAVIKYVKRYPDASLRSISNNTGVSLPTVQKYLRPLKRLRRQNRVELARLEKCILEHPEMTLQELANLFGVTLMTIRDIIHKNKLPYQRKDKKAGKKNRGRMTDGEKRWVRQQLLDHPTITYRELNRTLGYASDSGCSAALKRAGLSKRK